MFMRSVLSVGCVALLVGSLLSCGGSSRTGIIYLVGQSDQIVGAYQINLENGTLKTNGNEGSPQLVAIGTPAKTGIQPTIMMFNPGLTTAFLADKGDNSSPADIMSFTVNHDGTLAAGSTTKLQIGTYPSSFAMDSAGKFLFVAEQGTGKVGVFSVSGGSLTEAPGSPFALLTPQQATTYPSALIVTGVAVSNSGNFVYVTDAGNNIVVGFTFDSSSGALSQITGNPITTVGNSPSGAFSPPINNFLYVTNATSNDIYQFEIETSGSLTTAAAPVPGGIGPAQMLGDANAKYLLVVGNKSNTISGFRINQVTGVLTALSPAFASTGAGPIAATMRSDGIVNGNYWIVVSDLGANAVSTIELNTNTGALSALPQINAPVAPYGIASR